MWKISKIPFLHNIHPLVMAHRGDSANIPENTMPAFEDAYKLKVDCIETDARMTKDRNFVLFHDAEVDRTTEGNGKIESLTFDEIQKLDAGYRFTVDEVNYPFRGKGFKIHTIEEIIPKFPDVRFNLDIKNKDPEAPKLLAKKLEELNVGNRVMVASFHQKQINRFRKISNIPTSASISEVWNFRKKANKYIKKNQNRMQIQEDNFEAIQKEIFGKKLPYYALQIPEKFYFFKIITPEFINFAHMVGISVQIWTINDENDMKRLLNWGADGIFSDKPALLIKVINKFLEKQ